MCASGFQHPYSQEDLGSRLFQIGLEIDSWVNEEAESGVDPGLCVRQVQFLAVKQLYSKPLKTLNAPTCWTSSPKKTLAAVQQIRGSEGIWMQKCQRLVKHVK